MSMNETHEIYLSSAYLIGDLNQDPTLEADKATLPKEEPPVTLVKKIYGMEEALPVIEYQWRWMQAKCEQ